MWVLMWIMTYQFLFNNEKNFRLSQLIGVLDKIKETDSVSD